MSDAFRDFETLFSYTTGILPYCFIFYRTISVYGIYRVPYRKALFGIRDQFTHPRNPIFLQCFSLLC